MEKNARLHKRNLLIVREFYELFDVKRKRIDDVLKELEEERFFLDKDYIYSIIFYDKEYNNYYESLLNSSRVKEERTAVLSR